jgi:hypothetical protein
MPLTAPRVPTGRKHGVSTSARAVVREPTRAAEAGSRETTRKQDTTRDSAGKRRNRKTRMAACYQQIAAVALCGVAC